jgi:hypothetical protein
VPPVTSKRRAETTALISGPNTRPRKERQPNWGGPEVLALIGAKEKEHDAQRLSSDSRDNMEPALLKWTQIAEEVGKAGCSTFPRGPLACRDKWQTLFSEYKKICDYKGATGSSEDYFRMSSRRHKELTLPANFAHVHYCEMHKFLS